MDQQPIASDDRSEMGKGWPTSCLAIDIGGTKLAVGVVDGHGVLSLRASCPTPKTDDGDALFGVLVSLLEPLAPFDQYDVCGVGCGGPMTAGGLLVSPLNIQAWRHFPLAERLAALTGLAVRVDNDAKALALAEGWVGAAANQTDFMAMVVSTGIGGGIVLGGRLLDGATGNAGHVGHMVVAIPGRHLPNHVPGVLESEASGTAIAHHSGRHPREATEAERAEVGRLVGQASGSVVNLLDLPLVLVAGSVALGYGRTFFNAAQAELDRLCQLDFSRGARIEPAGCSDEGPLIGAGAVGLRHIGRQIGRIAPEEE